MDDGGVRDELQALLAEVAAELDDPHALGVPAERLRALVRKAGMPGRLRDDVLAAYRRLGDGVAVAVRSSAHGEDTLDASFAGMYDTYLNVVGDEELLDRVIDCWVSLYGERVIAYRTSSHAGRGTGDGGRRAGAGRRRPGRGHVHRRSIHPGRATASSSRRASASVRFSTAARSSPTRTWCPSGRCVVRQVRVGYKSHKAVPREDRRASSQRRSRAR